MSDIHPSLKVVGEVLRSAGLLVELNGPEDVAVSGASQDSRAVRAGDLFLAWKGVTHDSHDFVHSAVAAGAVAAVVERALPVDVPQLVVTDGRRAAALVADLLAGRPAERLFMVGITGTNGKTTTALLVRHLLSTRVRAAAIGTLGLTGPDGAVRPDTEALTTPGPVQLSGWLKQLVEEDVGAVVMEASSHALEQRRLDGVRFDVAIFTNLTQDHLDYHGDLATYRGAKLLLVGRLKESGGVVVNGDDPAWSSIDAGRHTLVVFSSAAAGDLRASDVELDASGSTFTLEWKGESRRVRFPLPAGYNVENALAAAGAGLLFGLTLDEVAHGLENAPRVKGRLEVVHEDSFTVLIDFAHTPDALRGALAAVRPLTRGRLIVVFGAGGDRDRTKRGPMAVAVAELADVVILTSDNPRTEDPERILDDLAVGLSGVAFHRFVDRRDAIRHALEMAATGDTVVLAGKGHETYQVIGHEKRPFDERTVVRDCLARLGAA